MRSNFEEASVTVVESEDLTKSPWNLAAPGISGSPRLLDIGGVPYLTPHVQRHKLYDMRDYPSMTGLSKGLVIGAGAAPWPYLNRNAEMMPNLFVEEDKSISVQKTKISRTYDHDDSYTTEKLPTDETRNSLLGSLFVSQGKTVLSTLVANDPGLDLRPEHSHGWGEEGQGGHYHGDTTPDIVEYTGYYSLAEEVFRVDRPGYGAQLGKHG